MKITRILTLMTTGALASGLCAAPARLDWQSLPVDDPARPQYAAWYNFLTLGERRMRLASADTVFDKRPAGDFYPHPQVTGPGLRLSVPRAFARPGDRWIEVFVEFTDPLPAEGEVRLRAELYAIGGDSPLSSGVFSPTTRVGMLRADLRSHELPAARLALTLLQADEPRTRAEVLLSAQHADPGLREGQHIPVRIDVPAELPADEAYGLTFGVPFPAGALWETDRLRLATDAGRELPGQAEVLARWAPDGAIKWVRFDTLATAREGLRVDVLPSGATPAPLASLTVFEQDDRVLVDTGTARYTLAKGASPITSIWRDGREVARSEGARGLYVIDQQGRLGRADADGQTLVVESAGPVAACIRFEGFYRTEDGEPLARHITRVEMFAGRSEARVTHTLVLTRDSNDVWFRDIGWELTVHPGADPRARFGVSRQDPDAALTHPLGDPHASAWILQDAHVRFGGGTNHFAVAAAAADGPPAILREGAEMGDWASLAGDAGGLMAAVRDAALQHPKEFEARSDRLVIRLFSNRAGEELDFRAQTLVDKWHLPETWRGTPVREVVAAKDSNAIGWAKTHALLLAPLAPDSAPERPAQLARLNAEKVYAHVDPHWIYATDALGGLHPKDPKQYPEVEAALDALIATFRQNLRGTAFYGFVDYNAGPTFSPRGSRGSLAMERRFSSTYQLRPDLWSVYARSGERGVRAFAEQTNRTFADNYMAHWDGPGKTRGLFMEGNNDSPPLPHLGHGDLPFYWENGTVFNKQDGTSLQHVTRDYFLTGNRRAADVTRQFAEGIKRDWTPQSATRRKRKVMTYRAILHAYRLTLDPELRVLAEATLSYVYDPEGVTGLTKNKELGATYKARCAVRALIEGWETFGTPPHYDMARRMAEHKWLRTMPLGGTTSPLAIAGNFLYRETESPDYAAWLDYFLHAIPQRRVTASPFRAADFTSGVALAQDVMARVPPADRARTSRAAYRDDPRRPVRIVVSKGVYDNLDVWFMTRGPVPAATNEWVRPLSSPQLRSRDRSLISMESSSNLAPNAHGHVRMRVNIPKEAPGEIYALRPLHHGHHYVVAVATRPEVLQTEPQGRGWTQPYEWTGRAPLVLHAPKGWRTESTPVAVYFNVPETATAPRIYFSEPTALFLPDGTAFADGNGVSDWVALPANQPGLWRFETSAGPRDIDVENLPPYFAFDDPATYFVPPVDDLDFP